MRKKILLCVLVAAAMGIGIASCVFSRPAKLWDLCPGLTAEACTEMQIWYENDGEKDDVSFSVTPQNEAFAGIMAKLEEQKYARSLRSLLPQGTRVHSRTAGDFRWKILLRFEDVTLPDGSAGSGTLLHIDDFFGELTVSFDGTDRRCTAEDQETWRGEIMDIILAAAKQKEG